MWGQWVRNMVQSRLDRATVRHISLRRGLRQVESGQPEQGKEQAALEEKGKEQIEGVEQARTGDNGACT